MASKSLIPVVPLLIIAAVGFGYVKMNKAKLPDRSPKKVLCDTHLDHEYCVFVTYRGRYLYSIGGGVLQGDAGSPENSATQAKKLIESL